MKKVVLFSPTGYVGAQIKGGLVKKEDVELSAITRNSKLDDICGDYDIMIYSASTINAEPLKLIQDNVLSAISIIDFCKKHNVRRVIYLSSDSMYGGIDTDEVSEKVVMVNPDFYGTTKYLAEKIIMESGIPYYILRMPGIVGKIWRNTYLCRLFERLCRNETITVYNAGKLFNNVIDIDDLVHFIILLCNLDREDSEIFLLGNTEKIELIKMVNYIKRLCGSTSKIDLKTTSGKRYFTLNVSKAVEYGYSSKSIWNIIEELYAIKNSAGIDECIF